MRKPYFKTSRRTWYVTVAGKQINLGPDKDAAFAKWSDISVPTNEIKASVAIQQFLDRPRKASTQQFYSNHLKLLQVNDLRVCDLRPFHLTDLLDKYKGCYAHNIARSVKTCFNWLADTGRIEKSPFASVKTPPTVSRGDSAYIEPARWERILEQADDDLHDILVVLRETGCRPKEARMTESRHLQDHCIVFPTEESKGEKSQRVIHLTDVSYNILQRLKLKYPTGPLLRRQGRPWSASRLGVRCRKMGFQPYQLRHTFCTQAILNGVDLLTIASLMGHANLRMISAIYSHIQKRDSHLRDSLERATA